jgi:hypothetical protein
VHLKEREEVEAISSELNIEVDSIPSSSSSFVDLSPLPDFAPFDSFSLVHKPANSFLIGARHAEKNSLIFAEMHDFSGVNRSFEVKKRKYSGKNFERPKGKQRSQPSASVNANQPYPSPSRIECNRQNDREKNRQARTTSAELIKQLDSLLQGPDRSSGISRTIQEVLRATSAAVRCNIGRSMMRSGVLSQRSSGMLVIDAANLTILDANAFMVETLGFATAGDCRLPLRTFLPPDEAAEVSVVLHHMASG